MPRRGAHRAGILPGIRRILPPVAALTLFAAACSGGDDSGADASNPTSSTDVGVATSDPTLQRAETTLPVEETVAIGLVAPSAVDDGAFTQSMVDSLELLGDRRPVEIEIAAELPDPDQALPAARQLATDGADLVIVHGSQFRRVVEQLADEFPDVSFAWGTEADDTGRPNVFSYSARSDQGGYVNGVVAAGLTTSGLIGAIGPIAVGDAGRYLDGFQVGVASVDAALAVNVTYIDSYTDVGLAREAAEVMTAFGTDVLTGTSQIVAGPIEVAAETGIPWLGTQSSQVGRAPETVAAGQVYHWDVALTQMLELVDTGTMGGALDPLTLANGGLTIEFNPEFDLPADVRTAADDAIAGLSDNSIETGIA
jgi:basic membrane protein A